MHYMLDQDPFGAPDFDIPDDVTPVAPGPYKRPRAPGSSTFSRQRTDAKRRGRPKLRDRYARPIDAQLGQLVIDLVPVMRARGLVSRSNFGGSQYPNRAALARGAGLAEKTSFNLLRRPETVHALNVDVIARICEFLRCQPGDWISYQPIRRDS